MDIITIVPIKWVTIAGNTIIAPDFDTISGATEARYLGHNATQMAVVLSGEEIDASGLQIFQTREAAIAALQ